MRPLIRHLPLAFGVALLAITALVVASAPALAAPCAVHTGAYPTIESAVRDATCQPINVPAGTYPENVTVNRSVSIFGAGAGTSIIQGYVRVRGAGSDILFDGFTVSGGAANVSGCWPAIVDASAGGTLDSIALVAANETAAAGDCRIFEDGFEFGTANAWSDIIN